jgi:hypothetical protein
MSGNLFIVNIFSGLLTSEFSCRDEDMVGSNDFLGTTLIPLYALTDGQSWAAWYPLYKRSSKSTISGEIEIELCCERLPGLDPLIDRLYREITMMPDMYFDMLPNPRSANNIEEISMGWHNLREAMGFPFRFPPAELEQVEDLSVRATLIAQSYFGKVSSPGILILTNYRIIFVSRSRLSNSSHFKRNPIMRESDLTCYIPLAAISDIAFSGTETDQLHQSQVGEALSIKTVDGRTISFFINASDNYDLVANNIRDKAIIKHEAVTPNAFSPITAGPSPGDMHIRLNGKKTSTGIANRVFGHSTRDVDDNSSDAGSAGTSGSNRFDSTDSRGVSMRLPGNILSTISSKALKEQLDDVSPGVKRPPSTVQSPPLSSSQTPVPDVDDGLLQMVGVSKAWEVLHASCQFGSLDALDSEEGGPAARMHARLYLKVSFAVYSIIRMTVCVVAES